MRRRPALVLVRIVAALSAGAAAAQDFRSAPGNGMAPSVNGGVAPSVGLGGGVAPAVGFGAGGGASGGTGLPPLPAPRVAPLQSVGEGYIRNPILGGGYAPRHRRPPGQIHAPPEKHCVMRRVEGRHGHRRVWRRACG